MLMGLFISLVLFSVILLFLFFFLSKKDIFDNLFNSSFECGFTSYFFSRFSFSIHYFMVGLIFLFLDLELCYLMPFMNEPYSSFVTMTLFSLFALILVLGLLKEWSKEKLDWSF